MEERIFPSGFLWGSATAAYQVEGGNNCDWTEWEKKTGHEQCLRACDHYNRFEEDFDIAKSLNQNAHRFSVEWSRIEPEEGVFDENEIEHYKKVVSALRARGIEPFVTLWHFTLPIWLAKKGGVLAPDFCELFARFSEKVVSTLGNEVKYWITINEPTIYIGMGYVAGKWPPQKRNIFTIYRVLKKLCDAHNVAYDAIKRINSQALIGFADNINSLHLKFLHNYLYKRTNGRNDFLGLNYYKSTPRGDDITDMGWGIYPQGMYDALNYLGKFKLPIYITENGIADAKDAKREKFIRDHLAEVWKAIQKGVDVRGYFYWSLLDNFEWDKGFWPRFGLVEVDYKTMERKIRPSAYSYAKICETNKI